VDRFKAYRLTETPERKIRAEFVELRLEDLDPGEVVVRAAYSDINYKDALAATGKGKILRRSSCIGGIDFSGTVVSSANSGFAKGDAVLGVGYDLGVSHHGGYSQYARVPAHWLVKLPQGMSLWDAMAFGTAGFTAGIGIVRMEENRLKPANGPVIVDGATGGVGSIAVSALSKLGYHVVALTGKEHESDWLKKLGAKEIKLRSQIDFSKTKPLDKATWAGAVDNLGGEVLAWVASTMKENGVIASIGLAASPSLNTTVMPFILRGVSLLGINSGESVPPEIRQQVWRRLATDMRPPLLKEMCRTIRFSDLPAAFQDFFEGKVSRRIVVDLAE
jgi:putative YhdH/YhfP family quinone oxidoreductase